jgi:hypothetical protein
LAAREHGIKDLFSQTLSSSAPSVSTTVDIVDDLPRLAASKVQLIRRVVRLDFTDWDRAVAANVPPQSSVDVVIIDDGFRDHLRRSPTRRRWN